LLVASHSSLWASFQLVEDFENGTQGTAPAGWTISNSRSNTTSLLVETDPSGATNLVGSLSGADQSANRTGNAFLPLGASIGSTSQAATLFLRFYAEDYTVTNGFNHFVGLAKPNAPSNWSDFTSYFGATGTIPDLVARDQSQTPNGANVDVGDLTRGQWYYAWLVVNNAADQYKLYVNTSGASPVAGDLVAENFANRDTSNTSIQTLLLRLGQNKDGNRSVFYDDIYLDTSAENLSNPISNPAPTPTPSPTPEPYSFNSFMDTYYPGESDPMIIGPTQDPDNDRKSNEWEYYFGTRPDRAENIGLPTSEASGNSVALTFQRLKGESISNYRLMFSETLQADSWLELEVDPVILGDGIILPEHYEQVRIYLPLPE